MDMKRVLIIQTAFLGDVILATALAETLHHIYPDAEIDILVKIQYASVFDHHPFLHEVLTLNKSKGKFSELRALLRKIRGNSYDAVINVHRFFSSGFLTAFSGATIRSGFSKNPLSMFFTHKAQHSINNTHETERNLRLLSFAGIDKTLMPALYPSESDFKYTSHFKEKPYICIAPASVWATKQYPYEQWVEFIKLLPTELIVYLIGGPDDDSLCLKIKSESGHPGAVSLSGKLSLLQTTALMKDALMNYVNDSAPLHLTSAANAPVTAIFCSTAPSFGFGPLSTDALIVETLDDLICRPCGLHGHQQCPEKHFDCAYTIDIQRLTNRTFSKLKKTNANYD
jgi:heptosyltransferase II